MITARFTLARGEGAVAVDATFSSRGISSIFGPSGCGKTTTLRVIAGLERPAGAVVRFGDEVWQEGRTFVPPHRRKVAYVFQDAALFPHLSVRGNLLFGLKRAAGRRPPLGFEEVVELLGLGDLLRRWPVALSGGEAQRVAIGRALLAAPRLLLLDEPLSQLDWRARETIMAALEEMREKLAMPVIHVSHNRDEVARLADHLLLMESGRVVAQGGLSELFARLDVAVRLGRKAAAVIETRVAGYDEQWQLARLEFAGGAFLIAGVDKPVGASVRLQVLARDVSLTLRRQRDTSILNIFPAKVVEVAAVSNAQALVRLDVSGAALLAGVTHKSVAALGLEAGREVFAQVKAVAVLS